MKKGLLIILVIIIILVIPVKIQYKDGGTVEYKSLTYKIIKWHRLSEFYQDGYKTGTDIYFFPDNFKSIDYYADVKPPYLYLNYNNVDYRPSVISYSWCNEHSCAVADSIHPMEAEYKQVIEVNKGDEIFVKSKLDITKINIYSDKLMDYDVVFDNQNHLIKTPNLTGDYVIEIIYKDTENEARYAFKINISEKMA